VQELNGSSVVANLLTGLGIDEYLMRTDSGGASHLLSDALGSTIALTDVTGGLPTSYTYAPFGETIRSGNTTGNAFDYTGREDDGTGLKYYRARYYHAGLQRFISQDPIGFWAGDVNLYRYVSNSPTNHVDPTGLETTAAYFTPNTRGASHIAIRVGSGPVYGFYPVTKSARMLALMDVPGELRMGFDRENEAAMLVTIATTPAEEAKIDAYLRLLRRETLLAQQGSGAAPRYNLAGRNCATVVGEALRAGGVRSSSSSMPLYFIRDLQMIYGQGVSIGIMP
jgi:RHS repeat-associated protein